MKINFKSTISEGDQEKVIRIDADLEIEQEEDFTALVFNEVREGKMITNRIEYNDYLLKIFSGVSTLHCELDQVIKNDYVIDGISSVFYLYTKLLKIDLSQDDYLVFEYDISNQEIMDLKSHIKLELTIIK